MNGRAARHGLECGDRSRRASSEGKEILVHLHHARWRSDASPASSARRTIFVFTTPSCNGCWNAATLELLWLTVRGEPVAALYGMAWGDKVYAYQTGRRLDVPTAVRPGGVILAHAIRRAIEAGRREFDLLADEAPYKLQLAPAVRPLVQVRAVRPGIREAVRLSMERGVELSRPLRRTARGLFGRFLRRRPTEVKKEE